MKITPVLMYNGAAEEAMRFYLGLFPDSQIQSIERYGAGGPGPEGQVRRAEFTIAGLQLACIDSSVAHAFTFTPAISLFVQFEHEAEFNAAFDQFAENGTVLMPCDNDGFSRRFGWVNDRYGVSWQLNLG